MKHIDLTNVRSYEESARLVPGGYACGIRKVIDNPAKEYLEIEFDIAKGEYAHYYEQQCERWGRWSGSFKKSYKDKALPFFKSFIEAVEASNPGYHFDGHSEQTLVRKWIGIVMGEEEYRKRDTGEIKVALKPQVFVSIKDIESGSFTIPDLKRLKEDEPTPATSYNPQNAAVDVPGSGFTTLETTEDLPF